MSGAQDAYLRALGITRWERRGAARAGEPVTAVPASAETTPAARRTASPDMASSDEAPAAPGAREVPLPASATSRLASEPASGTGVARRVGVVPGPGKGSCLYLCGADDDTDGALASDLARVLPEAPVWGRLAAGEAAGERLEALIAERLFTQVVVFGEAQADLLFDGEVPEQCGPARVTVAPGLKRLATDPAARRRCWFALKSAGCVARA